MSLRVDTSAQLVWAIANTEANLAGETRIRPIHFFLGILKVIDPQFLRQLQGVDLPDEDQRKLTQISKQVRQYLEMSVEDVTRLRRSLRRGLRDGEQAQSEIHMLHRSDESRTVFAKAAQKVVESGGQALSVLHLAEALFETGSINLEGMKKLKGRPSSKGAQWEIVNESEKKGRQRFAQWFGRNLSRLAAEGNLAPFVGRESEIRILIRALSRTNRRHVAILGIPGIGKTALVEGLATALLAKKIPDSLRHCEILEIHGSDVAADCANEADLSKRLIRLFSILHRRKAAILLLDDFHGLFPAHLKSETALALLTTTLSDDRTTCLLTTTAEQWEKLRTKEPSFARQFHVVQLETPSVADCRGMAVAWAAHIAEIQKITFAPEAIEAVLKAAESLPTDRAMPDRIVDLLENAATFVKVSALSSKTTNSEVRISDVQSVLAEHYGIRTAKAPRSISEM